MDKSLSAKIKTLTELARITKKLKKAGKKIVHCHGVFDLIHPGHIKHLSSAKKHGDYLIVTITADEYVRKGPGRPIFNESLRAEFLAAITHVDFVAVNYTESAIPAIKKLQPDFFVKGPDYKKRKVYKNIKIKLTDESQAVQASGGKMIFTDDVVFSSSQLINDYLETYPQKTKQYLQDFKKRHSSDEIIEKLSALSKIKVLVIGDAIIDQYHYCLSMGKSSKEPIVVHKYVSEESFLGGALATANHAASLISSIHLVTVLGRKRSFKTFIGKRLLPQVKSTFFFRDDIKTIIKRRFVDNATKQKLFQIEIIKDDFIPRKLEIRIISVLKNEINKYDLVIVNDFGHGMLTQKMIRVLCTHAKYLALNVQANSANYGFNVITKYPRADFVCIDEQELRLATHDKYSSLEYVIKKVFKKLKCREIIITRGSAGSISFSGDGFSETPALTQNIVDRVGAGDALFAISAPCIYSGMNSDMVSLVGNVAGALQVQTMGNKRPIDFTEMTKFITRLLK